MLMVIYGFVITLISYLLAKPLNIKGFHKFPHCVCHVYRDWITGNPRHSL